MSSASSQTDHVEVRASNIGGIDETTVHLGAGVNVLTGRNATNRTSFLQALMAGLGSDRASLKGDAEEGAVELEVGGQTYTRHLRRTNGGVASGGEPYLADPELADLFAFLLESNEARRAVAGGGDLRELIMRPVDTDAITAEIEDLKAERRRIDEQLDELEEVKDRLPRLERERADVESSLETTRAELEAKREELAELDVDVDERREEKEELEEKLDDLNDTRSDLEDVRFRIDTAERSLSSLREEREEVEAEKERLEERDGGDLSAVESRIEELRSDKRQLDSVVNSLQNLIRFNQDVLEGDDELLSLLRNLHADHDDAESGSVTDQLVTGDSIACWTCGSEVDRDRIESTLDRLREISQEKRAARSDVTDELGELKRRRQNLEQQRNERSQVERRLRQVNAQIDEREENVEELESRREDLVERIEDLEADVEALESEDYGDVLDKHKEVNQLEFEVERLEDERSSVEDEISSCEERIGEEESLRERREEISEELADLRTRIDRLESNAVEAFNEHMSELLDLLSYANLDRIWIERTERTVREGRRKVTRTAFDLHVIRRTDDGASYEDTVDHLSESEREVTGLVFALAGYLVHELHETVPFMLLDSLEAIDSERISTLIDYLAEYVDYLVVALLPEDAQALDDDYRRVEQI